MVYCYTMKGYEIRILRRSLGLTQQQFADKIGVTKAAVGRWEIDKAKPSPLALAKLKEIAEAEEREP